MWCVTMRSFEVSCTAQVEDNRAVEDLSDCCSESPSLDTSGLLTQTQVCGILGLSEPLRNGSKHVCGSNNCRLSSLCFGV